ncbi:MAG: hypothetical protein SGBAC_007435 [Bacillariaceae sp.]
MTKRVSFSQDVLVSLDLRCSMKHRQKMYLSRKEYQTLKDEVYNEADWARSLGAKELQENDHLRGLEMLIDEDTAKVRRKQKHLGHLAVFMEQDRQYLEVGCITPVDSESVAQRYIDITKQSKELAHKRALFYQEMEKVDREETELDLQIAMRAASLEPNPRFSVGPSAA